MSPKEQVVKELEALNESGLRKVSEFLSFLRLQSRFEPLLTLDESQIGALYAEGAEEDRALAEGGLSGYDDGLAREDS